MAKLTESQMKYRLNRKIQKEKDLRAKMEIEKKKEIFGDSWLEAEKKIKDEELKGIVSQIDEIKAKGKKGKSEKTEDDSKEINKDVKGYQKPTLFDCIELDEFFNPVESFKDKFGEKYSFYFDKYKDCKIDYKDAIDEINKNIYNQEFTESFLDEKKENFQNENKEKEEYKESFYKDAYSYIQGYVPIYNKYVCTCCGRPLEIQKFYINFSYSNLNKIDINGNVHIGVCEDCANKIFNYYYTNKAEKDAEKAMKMLCATLNLYWDVDVLYKALKNMELNNNKNHILKEYVSLINSSPLFYNKTFLDSPFLEKGYKSDIVVNDGKLTLNGSANTLDWSKEDLKNRRTVIKMVGYDVFEYESEENRKKLYNDLLGMLEPGMESDGVKLQAAIQIVISFLKVREINEQYRKRQLENAPVSELKALTDLKSKELKAIGDFSRDQGFSERFATAKAKGENTFTGILAKMNEDKFENAILNRYDIATSETIQQAANASFKAIFEQLSLGETDVWKIAQEQLAELIRLRKENEKMTEELRKTKYELSKISLERKAEKQGIKTDEEEEYD